MKDIRNLYSTYWTHELTRLNRDPYHTLEFNTTFRFLDKYLPKEGLILDAGGGTGIYSIALAKRGYDVVLLDYSKENLRAARREIERAGVGERVKGVMEGTITSLEEFGEGTFDAVLCLGGPLSLVHGRRNRLKAMSDLIGVAKRGAPIFISVMNRYGAIAIFPNKSPDEVGTSNFINLATKGEDTMFPFHRMGDYYCHWFTPEELETDFTSSGPVKVVAKAGLEGLGAPSERAINDLNRNKEAWENWMKVHYALCTKQEVIGASMHVLIVGKKK